MKVLVSGPCVYPLGGKGYGGMERLAVLVARGMMERGHEVVGVGGRGSKVEGVRTVAGPRVGDFDRAEYEAWRWYRWMEADAVVDFSHSHYFRRKGEPGVSWIWHDPYLMEPVVPREGLYGLSEWQGKRHEERTGQKAGVLDPICADAGQFRYRRRRRGEFFFSMAIMDANKGQGEIAEAAMAAGVRMKIAGKAVDEGVVAKVRAIQEMTEGRVEYLGEVSDLERDALFQECMAFCYLPSYKAGYGEAHSHKSVEALMTGVPCLVGDQGAMREVLGQYAIIASREGFAKALSEWRPWSEERRQELARRAAERWSVEAAVKRIEEVVSNDHL